MSADRPPAGRRALEAAAVPDLLAGAAAAARETGALLLGFRGDVGRVDHKADDSPVTAADRAAHDLVSRRLAALAPAVPVLSEEAPPEARAAAAAAPAFWCVDPLDGTKEFIAGTADSAVNVALVADGRVVLGVVHAPALGVTYLGSAAGAFRVDERDGDAARLAPHVPRDAARPVVLVSRTHSTHEEAVVRAAFPGAAFVRRGSALKLCLVADGTADLYVRLGPTGLWDTAAPQAVLEAAGGRVIDAAGRPLSPARPMALNPAFVAAADHALPLGPLRAAMAAHAAAPHATAG